MDGASDAEPHFRAGEVVDDVFRIAQGSGQSVEFGHDQSVSCSAGGQRFSKTWPCPVRSGEALIGERRLE